MEALQVLKDENLAENADKMGAYLRAQIVALNNKYVTIVRGKGLLNAIVITHPSKDAAWKLCMEMKNRGLLAKPTHGDKIRFAPPLLISKEEIDECIQIIAASLEAL
jgi:ornithine--oxo-acid transaminase